MKRRTPPAYQPLAIPFKLDHFRFKRQAELEQELLGSPLYAKVDDLCAGALEIWNQRGLRQYYPVPLAAFPVLQAAAQRFQTVARLAVEIEVLLETKPNSPTNCRAVVDGKRLIFILAPALLEETRPEVLTFHLAMNFFRAQQLISARGILMVRRKSPIQLEDRIKLLELLRLTAYAADAFALVCCGSLDVAEIEGFRRGFDVRLPASAFDRDAFAEHYLDQPEFSVAQHLDNPESGRLYAPGRILALRRFAVSEPYHACLGQPGGVAREAYEDEVLKIDQQVHPPFVELADEGRQFIRFAGFFGILFVMGAAGAITTQREQSFCDYREITVEQLREVERDLGWNVRDQESTRQALENALRFKHPDRASVHAVEILRQAYRFARQEHGEKLPLEVLTVLEQLGALYQLNEMETRLVCEHFAAELTRISDEER